MLRKVSKKLESTQKKVPKRWQSYRARKKHILGLKRMPPDIKRGLVKDALKETRQRISADWEDYRGKKYAIIYGSDIDNFNLTKKFTTKNTEQFFYKAFPDYDEKDLETLVPELLKRERLTGLLVILKVRNKKTDTIAYASELFTETSLARVREKGETIYSHVAHKFKSSDTDVVEYELISIHLRLIYEKAKAL